MTNTITNKQMFSILFLIIASNVMGLAQSLSKTSGKGGWIPIIIGAFIYGIAVIFICKLNNMYQNKVLFDYSKEILGKNISHILIIYFAIYFVIFYAFVNTYYINFIHVEFLYKTPEIVLLLISIIVFGFIANKGISAIARASEIIIPIYIIFVFICYILAFAQGEIYNILPLFSKDEIKGYFIGLKDVVIPYIGIEMLFIIPFSQKNNKSARLAFFTLLFIGIFYLLIFESTISMLGINSVQLNNFAGFEALKNVNIPLLERLDILYETIGFATIIFKLSFYYLVIIELLRKFLPKVKRWILVIIIGTVLSVLCILSITFDLIKILNTLLMITGTISSLIIPTILYITAVVKKSSNTNSNVN